MKPLILGLVLAVLAACVPTTINPKTGTPPLVPGLLEEDLGTPAPKATATPAK